jgi:hypothetical protein
MYKDLLNHKNAIDDYKKKFKTFKWGFFKGKKIIVKNGGIDTRIEIRYAQTYTYMDNKIDNYYVDIKCEELNHIIKLDIFDEIVYNILNDQYIIEESERIDRIPNLTLEDMYNSDSQIKMALNNW